MESTKTNATASVVVGMDVGNDYVKAYFGSEVLVLPSVVAKVKNTDIREEVKNSELKGYMKSLISNLDVSIVSNLVSDTARRYVGVRAVRSGNPTQEFNVSDMLGKSRSELTPTLVLSCIAGKEVVDYYEKNGELPVGELHLDVKLATALPIAEAKTARDAYTKKLVNKGHAHKVIIHNFEQPLEVSITFSEVIVAYEGETAYYAIKGAKEEFQTLVFEEFQKDYPNDEFKDWKKKDLFNVENILGIDIGGKTVDFPVITEGRFNREASSGVTNGFGKLLEEALDVLAQGNMLIHSRKELSEILLSKATNPAARSRKKKIEDALSDLMDDYVDELIQEVTKVFNKTGNKIDVVYVFGGGATPLKKVMKEKLLEKLTSFTGQTSIPVIFMHSEYSRYLNAVGLREITKLFE